MEILLVAGIALALAFNFVNGLNDAANSIATIVATRVLSPVKAVALAAGCNLIGPIFFTTAVAATIGKGIIVSDQMTVQVIIIGIAIAVIWILAASMLGIPISATHAMVGGLIGAAVGYGGFDALILPAPATVGILIAIAAAGSLVGGAVFLLMGRWRNDGSPRELFIFGALLGVALAMVTVTASRLLPVSGLLSILVFILVSPLLGFFAAFFIGLLVARISRNLDPKRANPRFRALQVLSSAYYSIGHGSNDAQHAMGIIAALLVAGGILQDFTVPLWVILVSCASISLGTFLGGWQVVRTMARKITHLRPYQGFCSETGGGVVLSFVTLFGVPVSSTHAISGAIMGVGATQGYAAVQWGMVRRIVATWILTIPLNAIFAWVTMEVIVHIFS
jgi:PiT family inorganic phosphate transporter